MGFPRPGKCDSSFPTGGADHAGYELSDFEWGVIAPLLPNKPRGVLRVDDRRVLNGIFCVLRTGAPWRVCADDRQHLGARESACRQLKKSHPDRCMGRSRGGLTTKIHALTDAHALPLELALTPGQAGDCPVAARLLGHLLEGTIRS